MKVCQFCGMENEDSVTLCSSCGGNEFKYKCGNCGTVFEGGNFCPQCGVKVGSEAKKCPNCGTEYYSLACPNCGYTSNHHNSYQSHPSFEEYTNTPVRQPQPFVLAQPEKKRKTWLWVLGWIFIFPVPLTILILRNKTMNQGVRIGIIVVAWLVYLFIGLGNSTSSDGKEDAPKSASIQMSQQDGSNVANVGLQTGSAIFVSVE